MTQMTRLFAFLLSFGILLTGAGPAMAQELHDIRVGYVQAKEKCQYFREYSGDSALVATPWMLAYASSWRSWLVKDCESQFATMRESLESALASSGKFSVGSRGYTVNVSLSGVTEGGPADYVPPADQRNEYHVSQAFMVVALDVTVSDRNGNVIYGGPLLKKIETGYAITADNTYSSGTNTGEAAYGQLQQEVALAVARLVAFKIEPLRVVAVDGYDVRLNYGGPLLKPGALVQVDSSSGMRRLRYVVTSSDSRYALAEMDGDNDPAQIVPGAMASVIEGDDSAANGRRYKRTRLP